MISGASVLPVMAEQKLIEIEKVNFNKMKTGEFDEFLEMLESFSEYDYCVLAICASAEEFSPGDIKKKKPSPQYKKLSEYVKFLPFEKEEEGKLASWCVKKFAKNGVAVKLSDCMVLVSRCGQDMLILSNEIDKVSNYAKAKGRNTADVNDIKKVCISTVEYGSFDFANAILDMNVKRAYEILSDLKMHKEEPTLLLGSISKVYNDLYLIKTLDRCGYTKADISKKTKIHEYKVGLYLTSAAKRSEASFERAVELCLEADRKMKTSAVDSYVIIERLILSLSQLR